MGCCESKEDRETKPLLKPEQSDADERSVLEAAFGQLEERVKGLESDRAEWIEKGRGWEIKQGEWRIKERDWTTKEKAWALGREEWTAEREEWEAERAQWKAEKRQLEEREKQLREEVEKRKASESHLANTMRLDLDLVRAEQSRLGDPKPGNTGSANLEGGERESTDRGSSIQIEVSPPGQPHPQVIRPARSRQSSKDELSGDEAVINSGGGAPVTAKQLNLPVQSRRKGRRQSTPSLPQVLEGPATVVAGAPPHSAAAGLRAHEAASINYLDNSWGPNFDAIARGEEDESDGGTDVERAQLGSGSGSGSGSGAEDLSSQQEDMDGTSTHTTDLIARYSSLGGRIGGEQQDNHVADHGLIHTDNDPGSDANNHSDGNNSSEGNNRGSDVTNVNPQISYPTFAYDSGATDSSDHEGGRGSGGERGSAPNQ